MGEDKVNILLVEDSETDVQIVRRILSRYMTRPVIVRHAETLKQAEIVLTTENIEIDVILLDLELPDSESREETFIKLEHFNKGHKPVLILTSINDRELAVSIVGGGADDYVRKSIISSEPELLCQAIDFAVHRHKKLSTVKEEKEKEMAEKDKIIKWISGGYSV